MNTSGIAKGLVIASALIALSLGLTWAGHANLLGPDMPTRIVMAVSGMIIAWYGNAIPKAILRSEGAIASRRFAGWLFALSGIASAVIWALAPIDVAANLSMLTLGGTIVAVIGYCLIARAKKSPAAP